MSDQKSHRLPPTVTPERYEIRLTPDLSAARFDGEEKIVVQVHEPVRQIRLNAAELVFQAVSMQQPGGAVLPGDVTLDGDNEQAALDFHQTLAPGCWELRISFSGVLNDKLHGFYRSTYKDNDGQEKPLASTQFPVGTSRRSRRYFNRHWWSIRG